MPRGRRPKPAAIRKAQGNPGRRPIGEPPEDAAPAQTGEQAPAPAPVESAKPPAWLDTTSVKTAAARRLSKVAAEVWGGLHGELVRLKLLKATDENAFARYCRYAAEWIEYTKALDREGAWYTTSSEHVAGIIRPHPAFRFRKDVEHALKELEDRIGLTPVARQRIFQQLAGRVPPQQPQMPGFGDKPTASGEGAVEPPQAGDGGDAPFGFLGSSAVN